MVPEVSWCFSPVLPAEPNHGTTHLHKAVQFFSCQKGNFFYVVFLLLFSVNTNAFKRISLQHKFSF